MWAAIYIDAMRIGSSRVEIAVVEKIKPECDLEVEG